MKAFRNQLCGQVL